MLAVLLRMLPSADSRGPVPGELVLVDEEVLEPVLAFSGSVSLRAGGLFYSEEVLHLQMKKLRLKCLRSSPKARGSDHG